MAMKHIIYTAVLLVYLSCHEASTKEISFQYFTDEPVGFPYENVLKSYNNSTEKQDHERTNMVALFHNESVKKHKVASWVIPETRPNIIVGNVGLSDVVAGAYYGHVFDWSKKMYEVKVKPGEKVVLDYPRPYFTSSVKFTNPNETRAFIYSAYQHEESGIDSTKRPDKLQSVFNVDAVDILLKLASARPGKEEFNGPALNKSLTAAFWPKRTSEILEDLIDMYSSLTEKELKDIISFVIFAETIIKSIRLRIEMVIFESDKFDIVDHYTNIMEDISRLEKQFVANKYTDNKILINYFTLPLVSQTINMKMLFYTWGITYAQRLNFTEKHVDRIKYQQRTMIRWAANYIGNFSIEQQARVYNICDADFFYSNMMDIRSYAAINGLEYIPIWKHIVDPKHKQLISDNLAYSEFFGLSSFNLNNHTMASYKDQPLTPKLVSINPRSKRVYRNRIKTIEIVNCQRDRFRICGLKLIFENGDNYALGDNASYYHRQLLHLNGARIMEMFVGGKGRIDYIIFNLSDGRRGEFGLYLSVPYKHFKLAGHHIVSMFASNDVTHLNRQLANLAVSYELIL